MASHYLVEPMACTPAAGWEKGRVENQVGNVREWLFTPKPRFKTLADLNVWLERRCREIGAERPTSGAASNRPAGMCSKPPNGPHCCRSRLPSTASPSASAG